MDSVLRPRDIQARIRSGESPETVAAAAQTSVDKIMGFATPVLAERAYVAEQAQKASVRRRAGDGPIGTLGHAVAERLATRDIDPESVEWDAWRREDGRWTLVAEFGAGQSGRRASFVYDAAGRYVMADDEESRWLVGERQPSAPGQPSEFGPAGQAGQPGVGDVPARWPTTEPGRRLSAVGTEQLPLGDDAIEVVTGLRPVEPGPLGDAVTEPAAPEEATVDLTETRSVVRSTPPSARVSAEPEALFDAPAVPPRQAEPPADADVPADSADLLADSEPTVDAAEPVDSESHDAETDEKPKQRKAARGRGRASVPSWDEIMFGSSRGE